MEESIQQNQEVLNQPGTVGVELSRESKRQKRLRRNLRRKNKQLKDKVKQKQTIEPRTIPTVNDNAHQELSSDWIIEYDKTVSGRIFQLADILKKESTTMTGVDKRFKVNLILRKIRKQQKQLRKLRQYVLSMLSNEQQPTSNDNPDILMTFLNKSLLSECWLCSGKTYTEVSTQCNNMDQ